MPKLAYLNKVQEAKMHSWHRDDVGSDGVSHAYYASHAHCQPDLSKLRCFTK